MELGPRIAARDVDPFHHVKVTGVLPDDPEEIIFRIKLRHNGDPSQSNQTLVDNLVFSATSGAPPAPPATSLLANGDFENPPYNLTYDPNLHDPENYMPDGWSFGGSGTGDDGPGQGFTNGSTSPTAS